MTSGVASGPAAAYAEVLAYALSLPGAWEDFPWGERVVKVGKKVFVFLGHATESQMGFSVKLPESGAAVLANPWATPTGYGLGKAGWVSCRFVADALPPVDTLKGWLRESYRAVAPKRLGASV